MASTEALWGYSTKLILQSGRFSSTIRDSQSTTYSVASVSYDGINAIYGAYSGAKIVKYSGKFTTTVKSSVSTTYPPYGAATTGVNTVGYQYATTKALLYSGQFTSTVKTSLDISSASSGSYEVSYGDGNVPLVSWAKSKLLLLSGTFSTTIKTSQSYTSINTGVIGISYDGDTLITGRANPYKLYAVSGQFTSTIKTSVDVSSTSTLGEGISTNDIDSRIGEDQAEFYSDTSVAASQTSSTTGAELKKLVVDRSTKTGSKSFLIIASWSMSGNTSGTTEYATKLTIDGTDYTSFDLADIDADYDSNSWCLSQFQMAKVTLDATEHEVALVAKTASATAGREAVIDMASIVAWEVPSDLVWNEDTSNSSYATETYIDKVTATFSSSAEDVLIVASADVAWTDESDPGAVRITVDDTEKMRLETDGFVGPTNDGIYQHVGLVAMLSSHTATNAVAALEYKGGGTGDNIQIKNARIFALPLGNLTSYTASNDSQSRTNTAYGNALSTSPTISTGGKHVAFFGSQYGAAGISDEAWIKATDPDGYDIAAAQKISDATDYDSGSADLPLSLAAVAGNNINSGSRTYRIKYASSSSDTVYADRNSITVIQVQAASSAESAGVSPVTATFSVPTITATATVMATASVSPVASTFSVPTTTATYTLNESATVAPVSATFSVPTTAAVGTVIVTAALTFVSSVFSVPTVTATSSATYSASVSPVTATFSVPATTATVTASYNAGVSPVTAIFSVPATTATHSAIHTASVAPTTAIFSNPTVTASSSSGVSASVSPVTATFSASAVTATHSAVSTASVTPVSATFSNPTVTATYSGAATASVAPVSAAFSVPATAANHDVIVSAAASPVTAIFSNPAITATATVLVTATVSPVTATFSTTATTTTYIAIVSATVSPVTATFSNPNVTAQYPGMTATPKTLAMMGVGV